MNQILSILQHVPEFAQLTAAMEGGACPAAVTGLASVHRAHFAAGLHQFGDRPVVLICSDEMEARQLADDLAALLGDRPALLPAREFTLRDASAVSHQWEHQRLALLSGMARGEVPVVVATIESLLQRTMPPELLAGTSRRLSVGDNVEIGVIADSLTAGGYSRCDQVEGAGQFAVRGGILDFFSPDAERPVRVEFFGDEIDSMGFFDPITQRRVENVESVCLLPAGEVLPHLAPGGVAGLVEAIGKLKKGAKPELKTVLERDADILGGGNSLPAIDRYLPLIYPEMTTAIHYLPKDAVVVFSESSRVTERAKNYAWQIEEDSKALLEEGELAPRCAELIAPYEKLASLLEDWPVVYLDPFAVSFYPIQPRTLLTVAAKQLPSYGTSLETAVSDLTHYQKEGNGVVVLCVGEQRALDLQAQLRARKVPSAVDFRLSRLPEQGEIFLTVGTLSAGMEYPAARLAVVTEGRRAAARKPRRKRSESARQEMKSFIDLTPGSLVIHENYGLGRFLGIVKMNVDRVEKDFIKIAYAGSDVLYVPVTQLDLISKYIGSDEESQESRSLARLGTGDWEKVKGRTRKAVKDLARGLIALYAERQSQPGYAFPPDTPWQREFEEDFEYTETDDQLRCAEEIKRDMERPIPMDRLLCGDVGYGKTEVAFRAVMKCILDGKQAAILVPTTILARQHYLSALQRFSKFPVNIEMASRFRTPAQMQEILRKVEEGSIDLLIGTHRLLQKDVQFKDLGLLVVDEEQRFGVTHKERLKMMTRQVDVLTLSATPIPRTLNMAMTGIRDMSIIEEPPGDRQPVQTYVLEHNWSVLADAMRRELERGGQVYYLHNRVETIARCAARVQEILGDQVSVGIAHGRMAQAEIDDVMSRMTDNEISVLVCTTIIETGIDLPNVNTLIIEDADRLGLAQIHQIRGRVGRSSRRAYAYLTYRQGKIISEVAAKRLSAIQEFAEFGSGFKIAMRDLEIRGAGNLLGPEQSGFMMSVGYDLYLKLLEEAVQEERGEPVAETTECSADLSVSANIPDRYVPSMEQRMDLYRRIARIRTEEESDDLVDEMVDRYGDPPRPVNNLLSIALLRAAAGDQGIAEITQKGQTVRLRQAQPDLRRVLTLSEQAAYRDRVKIDADKKPCFLLKLQRGENSLRAVRKLVEDYARIPRSQEKPG